MKIERWVMKMFDKKTKIIAGSIVALAVIVVLGIVYAAFTQQLTINGTATGRSSTGRYILVD